MEQRYPPRLGLMSITLLVDTGTHIPAFKMEGAVQGCITLSKWHMFIVDAFGIVQAQTMATVSLQQPGEGTATPVTMVVGSLPLNLLGLDVLKGEVWIHDMGWNGMFAAPPINIQLLHAAPLLPSSQSTNVNPSLLCLGHKNGELRCWRN